ncbi:hypothetical protein GCM10027022_18600 [Alpinimonas psychrophila]|uniref:Uncharacterized protein n=1 Tax=Alpinimonas psychrophila TaxID=748908 RepID=A0A7W3JUL5_9MICO|nr:hypothetical protein [Alpinimonas psychrophila]
MTANAKYLSGYGQASELVRRQRKHESNTFLSQEFKGEIMTLDAYSDLFDDDLGSVSAAFNTT